MSSGVYRSEEDIDEQINLAAERVGQGSRWPGMSYEQGVDSALRWVTGEIDDAPMED